MLLSNFSLGGDTNTGFGGIDVNQIMAPLMVTLLEQLLAQQVAGQDKVHNEIQTQAPPSRPTPQGMPIKGRLTQRAHKGHMALDFGAPVGTPVRATMDGKVVYAGWNNQGYGKLVIVENGPYRTYFAHLSKIPVQVGQSVRAGEIVGKSGNTGNSTGPHLHYEVRRHGKAIDPTKFTL